MLAARIHTNITARHRALMLAISAALSLGIASHPCAQAFPASINLGNLNGSNGFRLQSPAMGITSVSNVGDFNGDGFDDLIIGTDRASPNGTYSGASYVVFGKSTPFPPSLSLSSLNGSNGFRLDGVAADDHAGISVSSAGDINGDGIVDLIVGANGCDTNGNRSGSSYVVFGKNTPFPATLALASLNGSTGFRLDGFFADDFSGRSVSAAGDVNGDGIADLMVGADGADPSGSASGSTWVVFGKTTPFSATVALSSLNGSDGFRLDGAAEFDYAGQSVAAAGDVNSDGIGDLIIGAHGADPNGSLSGSSYVVFGKTTPFNVIVALSSLNGANGFRLEGSFASDWSGDSVSGAGDVNGDGIDDVIVGALFAGNNGSQSGSSYVVFGKATPFAATLALSDLNGSNGFRLDGVNTSNRFGASVRAAGDVNGDGVGDVIVGAPKSIAGNGYVVFGQRTPFSATFALSSLNGSNGFRLDGVDAFNYAGQAVSSAGDINGDGIDEVILSARTAAGSVSYVVFGRDTSAFRNGFE